MDPNRFHLDWERTTEVLGAIVVLSLVIERALAIVFEHRWYIDGVDKGGRRPSGLKEIISLAVAVGVCFYWDFDALSAIVLTDRTTVPGTLLTGAIIAGCSKRPVKLFRDYLGIRSGRCSGFEPVRDHRTASRKSCLVR